MGVRLLQEVANTDQEVQCLNQIFRHREGGGVCCRKGRAGINQRVHISLIARAFCDEIFRHKGWQGPCCRGWGQAGLRAHISLVFVPRILLVIECTQTGDKALHFRLHVDHMGASPGELQGVDRDREWIGTGSARK